MSKITVVPSEKGKFKVLVDGIQNGIEYSTRPLADLEAEKLYKRMYGKLEPKLHQV